MLTVAAAMPLLLAIADFRVNEVFAQEGGDPAIRFIELFVPATAAANCLFPTTRIEVYDGAGQLVGLAAPWSATVCYPGGSYYILATDQAAARFGVTRDARLDLVVPAFAGQVCLASSSTRYDCARWGPIVGALPYLRNTDDVTTAASIPDGQALARTADFAVVAVDFVLQSPTPRQPNDGTVWDGADAGPSPPDAAPGPDGPPPDGRVFTRPDATPPGDRPDAGNLDPDFLSADPGGGVLCSCRVGGATPPPGAGWLLALALLALRLRRP